MAQTLDHNNSITTVVPVEIPLFEDDLVIIQKLDDEPNDVGGLTAAELKAEFDKGSLTAQTYINETLIPRILADNLTEQARQAAESERVSNEIERVTNENARIKAESDRSAAEAGRTTAEEGRVKAEQHRAAEEAARVQAEQARVDTNSGIVARATAQANAATGSAASAATSAQNAAASEEGAKSAQSAAEEAKADAVVAKEDAEAAKADAVVAKEDAEAAKADAVAAKTAAEQARDEAQAIAGGDFVSVSDIVNDLVTNVSNKPLSAAQGVALKALIDAITVPTKTSQLTNDSGYLTSAPVASVNGKTGAVTLSASDVGAAPTSHASTATTYGAGTGSNYGHVKLSDNTNSTSGASNGVAATPAAVKSAYDLANTANTNANSKAPAYSYGTTDLTAGSSALETGKLHFVYE